MGQSNRNPSWLDAWEMAIPTSCAMCLGVSLIYTGNGHRGLWAELELPFRCVWEETMCTASRSRPRSYAVVHQCQELGELLPSQMLNLNKEKEGWVEIGFGFSKFIWFWGFGASPLWVVLSLQGFSAECECGKAHFQSAMTEHCPSSSGWQNMGGSTLVGRKRSMHAPCSVVSSANTGNYVSELEHAILEQRWETCSYANCLWLLQNQN